MKRLTVFFLLFLAQPLWATDIRDFVGRYGAMGSNDPTVEALYPTHEKACETCAYSAAAFLRIGKLKDPEGGFRGQLQFFNAKSLPPELTWKIENHQYLKPGTEEQWNTIEYFEAPEFIEIGPITHNGRQRYNISHTFYRSETYGGNPHVKEVFVLEIRRENEAGEEDADGSLYLGPVRHLLLNTAGEADQLSFSVYTSANFAREPLNFDAEDGKTVKIVSQTSGRTLGQYLHLTIRAFYETKQDGSHELLGLRVTESDSPELAGDYRVEARPSARQLFKYADD